MRSFSNCKIAAILAHDPDQTITFLKCNIIGSFIRPHSLGCGYDFQKMDTRRGM